MTTQSIKFDRAVEYYDETRGFPAEQPIAAMLAQVGNLNTSNRVLEIGVGTGRIALPLSKYVASYYGIDLSRPMMEKLKGKQGGEAVYITEGDATRLPFPDKSFDDAVVVHVFHLIPNWRDALSELARVLRPGAPLVHCWTRDEDDFRKYWDVWNTVVPTTDQRPGMHWQKNPNFLQDEGWRPQAEAQSYTFMVPKSPYKFLEHIKARIWSAMWSVTDEDLARGLAAIEPLIQADFPDRNAAIEGQSIVYARAYLPPS